MLKELGLNVEPFIEDNDRCPFKIGSQRGQVADLNLGTLVAAGLLDASTLAGSGLAATARFGETLVAAFTDIDAEANENSVASFLSTPGKGAELRRCAEVILELRNGVGGMHTVVKVGEFANIVKLHSGSPVCLASEGFDQIAQRLHDRLPPHTVLLNAEVIRICDSSEVSVEFCKDGVSQKLTADVLLFACPALHKIAIEPALPAPQQAAVQRLRGSNVAMKCVMLFSRRFWEEKEHGGVVGGRGCQQVFMIVVVVLVVCMCACTMRVWYLATQFKSIAAHMSTQFTHPIDECWERRWRQRRPEFLRCVVHVLCCVPCVE